MKRRMALASYVKTVLGRRIEAPGALGGECVDLADDYLAAVYGLPPVRANAVDWIKAYIPGFAITINTPTNYPPSGAIAVWGEVPSGLISFYGHVAVVLTADRDALITIDQNWQMVQLVRAVGHDYTGVLGWLTPMV